MPAPAIAHPYCSKAAEPMRVALVFPNYWPYVRRGAERLVAEYATYLAGAGHEVDVITSKPGPRRVVHNGNLTVFYEPSLSHPVLNDRVFWFRFYAFTWAAFRRLMAGNYDVAHVWLYTYGMSARLARHFRGTPYLYHSMGEVLALSAVGDQWLFPRVAGPADRAAALPRRAADIMQDSIGMPVSVLPACVDTETFAPRGGRDLAQPRVLFVSDMSVARKGATLLLMAWDEIHRRCPNAILTFAGPAGQVGERDETNIAERGMSFVNGLAARDAVEFVGEGRLDELPARYAASSVTVMPS